MLSAKWSVLTVAMAAVVSSSVWAVGKVTVDPNTSITANAKAAAETDARLDRKITYEARRKTVSAILADLSALSGVTFHAGYNGMDWQVRDRKMNIFVHDVSLRELMDSIAHVMKFKWSKSDKADVCDCFCAYAWSGAIYDLTGHRDDAIAAYKEALAIYKGPVSYAPYDLVMDRKWVEDWLKTPFKRE